MSAPAPSRLHRPVVEQIVSAIAQIFGADEAANPQPADKVIERLFKNNRRLGARDRRLVAESTYDIVRWWRLLWFSLDREQPSMAAPDLWRVFGAWLVFNDQALPEWNEFKGLDPAAIRARRHAAAAQPAVRESVPDWLYEIGSSELGAERWGAMLTALNREAPVVLRANRLKIARDHLMSELRREDVQCIEAPDVPDGLVLEERRNVFATEAFKLGYFEVQDGASQQAAPFLGAEPGDRVIDACAGAGGKTLHLAAMMRNKGKIIALDVHPWRLEELRKRCRRGGVDIVETRHIDSSKVIKRLEKTADRVLLDVPCSGLGVLRRNPDAKWKLRASDIHELHKQQAEILASYSEMAKVGGHLVYATCSVLPSENSRQVHEFMKTREGAWKLLGERNLDPGSNGYDGFYMARMQRLK